MNRIIRLAFAAAAVSLLAACGGGSSSATAPSKVAATSVPPASAVGSATGNASAVATAPTTVASPGGLTDCPSDGVTVHNAGELTTALSAATPGTVIHMTDGTYPDGFTVTRSGTPAEPIYLCGSRGAVLEGSRGSTGGYVLHLDGASWWRVIGFSMHGGQKGLVTDGASHDVIAGLAVSQTGDEAIHLRSGSSDTIVSGNVIRNTGLSSARYGEGIYVGSAKKNWCKYSACGPDRSDRNIIIGNDIAETTAENIDVKEGTDGGTISGNRFSGAGMTDADSWIDLKGNAWTVTDNTGSAGGSLVDGIQTHVIVTGWGNNNVIRSNRMAVSPGGYGVNVSPKSTGTVVGCDNVATGGKAAANISCTGA